jgi:hypothetical protein
MSNTPKASVRFLMIQTPDSDADVSYLEDTAGNYAGCTAEEIATYVAQDQARLAAYHNDEWHMIGIRCRAEVTIEYPGYRTTYTMESAGLWGIESDSGDDYLASVYDEERAQLVEALKAMKELEL